MVESTPDAAASEGAPVAAPPPVIQEPKPNEPLNVRALLSAGAHFGHRTGRWNPKMKPYIFGERNGIHIIDLDQTLKRFQRALDFLRETAAQGGKVLFVGTKQQAQAPIETEAQRSGQFYVNRRWLGGMLTNFRTVKKSIDRFKSLIELSNNEEDFNALSKRERSRVTREIGKYRKSLDGIQNMAKLPDALFVVDVNREHIAVNEAQRLGIPVVAVVDTNCEPQGIDYVIPANDDAIRAILLYCMRVGDACLEGGEVHNERVQKEVEAQAQAASKDKAAAPSGGRVVVEIQQQARRSHAAGGEERGGRGRGGRRRKPKEETAEAAGAEAAAEAKPEQAEQSPKPDAAPAEDAESSS